MNLKLASSLLLLGTLTLGGCAVPGLGSGDYERGQTRGEQTVRTGVVDSVRGVRIDGTRTGVGAIGGAAIGGVAGSSIGRGNGSTLAAIAGAIAGGVAGQAAEQGVTKKQGVEITVLLDSGKMVAVTQEVEADQQFKPGDRVRILSGGGVTRVTH